MSTPNEFKGIDLYSLFMNAIMIWLAWEYACSPAFSMCQRVAIFFPALTCAGLNWALSGTRWADDAVRASFAAALGYGTLGRSAGKVSFLGGWLLVLFGVLNLVRYCMISRK